MNHENSMLKEHITMDFDGREKECVCFEFYTKFYERQHKMFVNSRKFCAMAFKRIAISTNHDELHRDERIQLVHHENMIFSSSLNLVCLLRINILTKFTPIAINYPNMVRSLYFLNRTNQKLNTKFIAAHHLDWNTLKACKFFLQILHSNFEKRRERQ